MQEPYIQVIFSLATQNVKFFRDIVDLNGLKCSELNL